MTATQDTLYSSYREILIEHLFVGEVMRRLWLRGITQFEVLEPQLDDSGYDLVLEANGVVRHLQLKSSSQAASTANVKASLGLATKPSGCIVWVHFDPATMQLGPYLWLGGVPGSKLPDIRDLRVGKHTKANALGIKKERPNTRVVPRSMFEVVPNVDVLVSRIFGESRWPWLPSRVRSVPNLHCRAGRPTLPTCRSVLNPIDQK